MFWVANMDCCEPLFCRDCGIYCSCHIDKRLIGLSIWLQSGALFALLLGVAGVCSIDCCVVLVEGVVGFVVFPGILAVATALELRP